MRASNAEIRALEALRQSWPGAFRVQRSTEDYRGSAQMAALELVAGGQGEIDRLFREMDIRRPHIVWAPKAEDLPAGPQRFLLDFWCARQREGAPPRSATIDALDLKPALGNLMLLEPVDQASDFRYRVYGSNIVEYSRVEMTGRTVWDIPAPWAAAYFVATYRAACERIEPLYARHFARLDGQATAWDRLILPFVDADGWVDRLLVGNIPDLER
jgi:hypothetical protein